MSSFVTAGGDIGNGELLAQNAQDTANDANKKNSANSQQIANINDPNYLTPFEKPQLEIQMDNFATIYAADKDIATSESIDFTAYEAAYQAYLAYMTPLVANMTTYSPIVRSTFNGVVTAVQVEQKRLSTATQAQYNQQIKQAQTDIDDGQTKYQALQADAANMKSDAANVATTASQAIASAGFANDTANAAQSSAMAAVNQAGFASDTSVQASQAASSAVAAANEATAGATTAKSDAANALTSATTAFNTANGAKDSAGTALDNAKSALNKVNGLQFGGRNLILNSANLSGFPTWVADGNKPTTTADGSEMTIVTKHGGLIINSANLSKNIPNIGDTVTISVEAKGTATLEFNYQNGNDFMGSQHFTVTDEYKRYFAQYTWNPINVSANQQFVIYTNDSTDTTLIIKNPKLEVGNVATDWTPAPEDQATVTALMQVKQTADGAQVLATNNKGDITSIQETAKGLQSSVNSKASSDQLTQLSDQLTNKISDLSSSTNSQFTQISGDINDLVKKGDVVNQFNLDAGGILLDTSGSTAKIILSSNNIELDSANPVVMGSANITNLLTSKTIEASNITSTTKIIGSDIQAAMIHSADNSFSLNGATGDIIGPSIHSADGAWGITANGKISGTSVTSSLIDISGDGSGPNFDAENVTPDTATGIYSRYKYANPNVGFDVNGMGRKMYKNGYLVINGDTFLNRTIGDWSADGGGKYVYDTMYEANVIKMRAYNYTGSNVQTDDPSKTQGAISSRLDIQPSAITMGPDWSVGNPNILINRTGRIKGGLIAANAAHSIGTTDGGDLYFMKMNKDATNVGGSSIPIHVKGLYTSNLGMNNGHIISSFDGGDIYVEDTYHGGGNMVNLHVKKLYQSSLLSLKTDIKPIDPHEALTEVVKNDVMGYHFKNDKTTDPKSVSVILDDINPIPKYYTSDIFKSADGTGRNDGNIVGYLMLSIKDLNSRLQKLEGAN